MCLLRVGFKRLCRFHLVWLTPGFDAIICHIKHPTTQSYYAVRKPRLHVGTLGSPRKLLRPSPHSQPTIMTMPFHDSSSNCSGGQPSIHPLSPLESSLLVFSCWLRHQTFEWRSLHMTVPPVIWATSSWDPRHSESRTNYLCLLCPFLIPGLHNPRAE